MQQRITSFEAMHHLLSSIYQSKTKHKEKKRKEMKQSHSHRLSSLSLLTVLVSLVIVISVVVCTLNSDTKPSWSWRGGGLLKPSLASDRFSPSSLVREETLSTNFSAPDGYSLRTKEIISPSLSPHVEKADPYEVTQQTITIKRYSKLEKIEAGLARARASIRAATKNKNLTKTHEDPDYVPQGQIYRNAYAFHRSYLEMEKQFKIFVYEEGDLPMFHNGPCKSIYSTEGRFIHQMEVESRYRTRDPDKAHVYFLPFSVVMMVQYLYKPDSRNVSAIARTVVDYIDVIAGKYLYWNRSLGADHFMLSCHDWGPRASSSVPKLFDNSIRVLCNANTSEGFKPYKDASFPEIHLRTGEITGLIGGPSPSRRTTLAFFAGRLHGHIRLVLLKHWKEKDQDVQVYERLPDGVSYNDMLKKSKYCLCPSGYEVASPRVVEAIYSECVPVLISDHYIPPFSDVLNWDSFSIQIPVKDIPNIKKILMGISQARYIRMQKKVKQVQKHFVVNGPPKRFDVFHMIIHSIWLRRLNIRIFD